MRRNVLKAICMMLALFLVLSSFVACSNNKNNEGKGTTQTSTSSSENSGTSGEIPTYKLVMATHGAQSLTTKPKYYDEILTLVNEKLSKDVGFKVDLEIFSYPDDQFAEKINLDLSSGKTYDLIRHAGASVLADLNSKGLIKDITDVINNSCPTLKKSIPENVWQEVSIDGKYYAVPMPAFPVVLGSWIRGEWLEKAGLPMPTTVAELENVLKAFRDGDYDGNNKADTVPWVIPLANMEMYLLGTFTETPGDFADANGNVMPKIFAPGYKDYLATLQRWYKEKYIDEMLFNGDEVQAIDVYGKNKAGICGGNIWQLEWGTLNAIDKARPEMKTTFLPHMDKDVKKYLSPGIATEFLYVPTTSKNTEAALKYTDWLLYNKEAYTLAYRGIENKTYVIDGDSVEIPQAEKDAGVQSGVELTGYFHIGYNAPWNFEFWPKTTPAQSKVAYKYAAGVSLDKLYVSLSNFLGVSLPDDTRVKKGDADAMASEYIADIIRGKKDISAYDQMLKEYEKLGGLEAYKLYTDAYKK